MTVIIERVPITAPQVEVSHDGFLAILTAPKERAWLRQAADSISTLLHGVRKASPWLEQIGRPLNFLIDFDVLRDFLSAKSASTARSLAVEHFFIHETAPYAIPLGAFLELLDWLNDAHFDDEIDYRSYSPEEVAEILRDRLGSKATRDTSDATDSDWLEHNLPSRIVEIERLLMILRNSDGRFLGVLCNYSTTTTDALAPFISQMERSPREGNSHNERNIRDSRDAVNLAIAFQANASDSFGQPDPPFYLLLTNTRGLLELIDDAYEVSSGHYQALLALLERLSPSCNPLWFHSPIISPRQLWAWSLLRRRSPTNRVADIAGDFEARFQHLSSNLLTLENSQHDTQDDRSLGALYAVRAGLRGLSRAIRESDSPLAGFLDSTLTEMSVRFDQRTFALGAPTSKGDDDVVNSRVLDLARALRELALRLDELDQDLVVLDQHTAAGSITDKSFSLRYGVATTMQLDIADGEVYLSETDPSLFVIRWPVTCLIPRFLFSLRKSMRVTDAPRSPSAPRFKRLKSDSLAINNQDGVFVSGDTIDFLLSPNRDLTAARGFLRLALSAVTSGPRVINVDGHAAYPTAIAELKESGELSRRCRCRPSPYLNNIIEQDHRFVKKRITASQGFRSVHGALSTIAGYEAMNIIRKAQIRWLPKGEVVGQKRFIERLFGIAA